MEYPAVKVDDEIFLEVKTYALAPDILELIHQNQKYLAKWLTWAKQSMSLTDERKSIQNSIDKMAKGEMLDYFIFYKNQLVGSISLFNIDYLNSHAEIGYLLAEEFQGNGIMTRSLKSLIQLGFKKLKLHKITLYAASDNDKSNAVAVRAGMTLEATLKDEMKINNRFHDMNCYYILNK